MGKHRPPIPSLTPTPSPTPKYIPCGVTTGFSGGSNYPTIKEYGVGYGIGSFSAFYAAYNVPDRFVFKENGVVLYDTGYVGSSSFAYGGSDRAFFKISLNGKIDPITGFAYPFNGPNNSVDGYPIVTSPGNGSVTLFKTNTSVEHIVAEVYAPFSSTVWDLSIECLKPLVTPVDTRPPTPTPTTTQTNTPSTTQTPKQTTTFTTPTPTPSFTAELNFIVSLSGDYLLTINNDYITYI